MTTKQQAAILCQELAELEQDCSACKGTGGVPTGTTYGGLSEHVACDTCGGSGKVDLFTGVRVPCPCIWGNEVGNVNLVCSDCMIHRYKHGEWCCECHGKGWVASEDIAVWLAEALKRGDVEFSQRQGRTQLVLYVFGQGQWPPILTEVEGEDVNNTLLALLLALKGVSQNDAGEALGFTLLALARLALDRHKGVLKPAIERALKRERAVAND